MSLELSLVWVQRKFSPNLQEFFDIVERLLRASVVLHSVWNLSGCWRE